MGLPFSQQPGPVAPTGVVAPPVPAGPAPVVVADDEGDRAPGLNAPPDDIAGEVAVVGCPPLTSNWKWKIVLVNVTYEKIAYVFVLNICISVFAIRN